MLHIDAAKKELSNKNLVKAARIIENLLILAPKNTTILKLKSYIARVHCQFEEELKLWRQVGQIDNYDQDALGYFESRALEERERYFFTKNTEDLGKLFIVFPNTILWFSTFGFFGCVIFLVISQLFLTKIDPNHIVLPIALFSGFFLFVCLPWFFIIHSFFTSLRNIELNRQTINFKTRLKEFCYNWDELSHAKLVVNSSYTDDALCIQKQTLYLQVPSKDWLKIDLTPQKSAIRVSKYFITLFRLHFKGQIDILTNNESQLALDGKILKTF